MLHKKALPVAKVIHAMVDIVHDFVAKVGAVLLSHVLGCDSIVLQLNSSPLYWQDQDRFEVLEKQHAKFQQYSQFLFKGEQEVLTRNRMTADASNRVASCV